MNGYLAAAVAVFICASYPVATRAGVTGTFTAQELVTLRFGVGALLFLPYLLLEFRSIAHSTWARCGLLTLFQGAGMGALVIYGLQLAPANHAAALGPGASPAWVVLLGYLVHSRTASSRGVAGALLCAGGVLALTWWSASEMSATILAGDLMFLAASALGALYVLQMRIWGIPAIQAAAMVTVYSALILVPWHWLSASMPLSRVPSTELLWQVLWQGALIGCVVLIALNHAISKLGAERSSALIATVPVLTAVLAMLFLGEVPSAAEVVAFVVISAGVSIAAAPGKADPMPAIQTAPTPPQSVRTAGYPARGSAPGMPQQ